MDPIDLLGELYKVAKEAQLKTGKQITFNKWVATQAPTTPWNFN